MKFSKQYIAFILVFGLILLASIINLDQIPAAWWDEGWTLNVARNWIESGHYGQLIDGDLRDPGLSASFPIVAPITLSFYLFGIDVWQGRLPSLLSLISSVALVFYLASQLYNRKIAFGSLFVLFLLSGPLQLHPLTLGRTVLAEIPMLFYLLTGYAFLLLALRKSTWWILAAALFWGIAINAKAQALPFWLASLLLPLGATLIKRWWQQAGILFAGLLISWLVSMGLQNLVSILIPEIAQGKMIPGLLQVVAVVLDPQVRRIAITYMLIMGLPTLIGFFYAVWKSYNTFREQNHPEADEIVRLTLLGFVGSWLAWYAFLALFIDRYLFPALFVGSIFTSAFFYQLTFQFNFKKTFKNTSAIFFRSRNRYNIGALIALPVIVFLFLITTQYLFRMYTNPGASVAQVTDYIESITDEQDLIETYESELYFMLDRRYHYPPDEIDVQIISRELLGKDVDYTYDPLAADPDYLVIGRFGTISKVYDKVLSSEEFELVHSIQGYDIYSRNE